MGLRTYSIRSERVEGLKVKATARDFSIMLDEPKSQGGTDTGMNPVELALCSIGACQTITATIFADFYGIPLNSIWVQVEGDMDPNGFSGMNSNVRPGLQKIRSTFHISSNVPKVQIQELIKAVERMCPVGDSFRNTVEVEIQDIFLNE